jgi:hypothetical protein
MKKFIFLLVSAAFMFALSSCDQNHKEKKEQKERSERRW